MGEFVNHHVVRGIAGGRLAAVLGPGDDDRPAFPGFACSGLVELVHQSGLVLNAPGRHVFRGIDDDPAPAAVPVDSELADRQTGLRCNGDLDPSGQLQAPGAGHHLGRQQPPAQLAQARVARGTATLQEVEIGQHAFPQRRRDIDRAGTERIEQACKHAALCPTATNTGA